jgi:hypothetical protein
MAFANGIIPTSTPGTFRLKINNAGIGELLRSAGVKANIAARAERVGAAARSETTMPILVEDKTGVRARYRIVADDSEAKLVEARTRLLGRAIDAARG